MIIKISIRETGPVANLELSWDELQAFKKLIRTGLNYRDHELIDDAEAEAGRHFTRTIDKIKVSKS